MDLGNLANKAKDALKGNEEKIRQQATEKADQLIDSKVSDESTAQKAKDAVDSGVDKALDALSGDDKPAADNQ
ncbi:hypothetical protein ACFSSC_00250 [Corynebacterium mendelii]|uniref:Antitoxin n=1 Tax=Corynebacterium mendelii TaxID=2765362 RepID=A0A939IX55_9CORY|nr:hypothetical protein [Corynebacterium mendelii]MBN9643718.1 hypothetical protein [Corynebacterium mendelii]